MRRMRRNAPSGTAITTAMMAMKEADPTNSEPEDDADAAEPLWEDEQTENHTRVKPYHRYYTLCMVCCMVSLAWLFFWLLAYLLAWCRVCQDP